MKQASRTFSHSQRSSDGALFPLQSEGESSGRRTPDDSEKHGATPSLAPRVPYCTEVVLAQENTRFADRVEYVRRATSAAGYDQVTAVGTQPVSSTFGRDRSRRFEADVIMSDQSRKE